jgi:hypothetical protein
MMTAVFWFFVSGKHSSFPGKEQIFMAKLLLRSALLPLALAILVAGCLVVAAPKTSHAAGYCSQWEQVGYTQDLQSGKANLYVYLYRLTDQFNDDCGKFYAHVDAYVWENASNFILAGVGFMSTPNFVYRRISIPPNSPTGWFHLDSPILTFSGCGTSGYGAIYTFPAQTGTACD